MIAINAPTTTHATATGATYTVAWVESWDDATQEFRGSAQIYGSVDSKKMAQSLFRRHNRQFAFGELVITDQEGRRRRELETQDFARRCE